MYAKELIKILKENGWSKVHQKGSHIKMQKDNKIVIIPYHQKDIPIGTLNSILKQAGLK